MKLSKIANICVLVALVVGMNNSASAFPRRQSSDNGQGNAVDDWTVLGRTVTIPLSANGKKVTMTRQIICAQNGDRVNGSCGSGNYVYLFQFQSTSSNVTINIGLLQKGTFTGNFYAVNVCNDDPQNGNSEELCTEAGSADFSQITYKMKSKTAVSFTVAGIFPSFPAGTTPEEGQGLTFAVQTSQPSPLPITFPSVGIQ
jgi:hypothetical protein